MGPPQIITPLLLLRKRSLLVANMYSFPPSDSNLDHRLKLMLRFKIGGAWGAMMGLPSGRTFQVVDNWYVDREHICRQGASYVGGINTLMRDIWT